LEQTALSCQLISYHMVKKSGAHLWGEGVDTSVVLGSAV
jgi:hypothetical protein